MAKKRKSENAGMDEVDRTLYTSFVAAANSISQLYTQAQHQQKLAFLAGQRHASDKILQWLQRGYGNASEVPLNDLLDFLQRQVEPGGVDSLVDFNGGGAQTTAAGGIGGGGGAGNYLNPRHTAGALSVHHHHQQQPQQQQQSGHQQPSAQSLHTNMALLSCGRSGSGGAGGGGGGHSAPEGLTRDITGMATLLRQGATLLGGAQDEGAGSGNDAAAAAMAADGRIVDQTGKMSVMSGGVISSPERRSLAQYTAMADEPFRELIGRGSNPVCMATNHERESHGGQAETMINNLFSRSTMIGADDLPNGRGPMIDGGHHQQQMSALHQSQQTQHHHHHHPQQQQQVQGRAGGFVYGGADSGGGVVGDDEDACMDMGAISLEDMYAHTRVF